MKTCFLSIDIEHDRGTFKDKKFHGVAELDKALSLFEKHETPATLFVTGDVILKYPDKVKKWNERYEIASHSYSHEYFSNLSEIEKAGDIDKSLDLYRRILKTDPKGFRAPSHIIDGFTMKYLEKRGFLYDSSVVPHYPLLKKYRGYSGSAPKAPYNPDYSNIRKFGSMEILEIPVSGQILGIPLAGAWIRKVPMIAYRILFAINKPEFITFSMHSWDIAEDKNFSRKIEDTILLLKSNGYILKTGESILSQK
ncbi:MAG: hypothetical protein A3B96_01330 [Candidatus Spechtbacteria bacterium RIFCSPHIGHO2_02_FULL_43_15b]|uniref:NodB homology domain-containing protein n=1 Tax=Candidatus Spechtbacteria bacterium RIFCSPHIGHO2_01_FULL_43_30 TaxID=1802158 RepID=A0A1G2H4H8_9BACT|nr:MAG: hypothetical protein A2827_03735 [Candidatus Spechtbacteria bacterium RIFCSPHIGHO2_01_FULL_43_30]OGZ59053.1 MAG: hypothetical protein A3B96_01330 [Candidatus Spechtbacteria bacterium RIFCSPHIGHO2_02_FULL_43_15b]